MDKGSIWYSVRLTLTKNTVNQIKDGKLRVHISTNKVAYFSIRVASMHRYTIASIAISVLLATTLGKTNTSHQDHLKFLFYTHK